MMTFEPGLIHAPLTPFTDNGRINFDDYLRLLSFHVSHGADCLALPMHVGEAVNMSDAEQRKLIAFALENIGNTPVIAHVTDAGTQIAADRAVFAAEKGAQAIVATTPYYWTPPQSMLIEHFTQIAAATSLPFYVHNAPADMSGVKINLDLVLKLIDRAPNFLGVIDSGLDWQFMLELVTEAPKLRPEFQLVSGNEFLVSASAIGATSCLSTLAAITPLQMRKLYDACRADHLFEARKVQEAVAELYQIVKTGGVAALKAASSAMNRDLGSPRPPLSRLGESETRNLTAQILRAIPSETEPRGWV
jgi:4-hydroxy-tetrahydrodipicolinate synthase